MREIPLTQGKVALVDDADYEELNQWKWYAWKSHGIWYARRTLNDVVPKGFVLMHRAILNAPIGILVDHQDGDGLNNQRSNIRLATRAQNGHNRGPLRNNKSGYKGVSRSRNRWRAQIQMGGKVVYLGLFREKERAARAYQKAARGIHKDFYRVSPFEKRG